MKLRDVLSFSRLSRGQIIGLAMIAVGVVLLVLAYNAQSDIDRIGATNDPILQERVKTLESERGLYLVTAVGTLFMGLFAVATLAEPSMPLVVSGSQMISGARAANDTIRGMSLLGNSCYLPSKHGLTRERVLVEAVLGTAILPVALSDDLVMSPGKDGSSPGVLLEPAGLSLLDSIETGLGTKTANAGIEAAEGSLQTLKHGIGMMKDFHFKEREGKLMLRVEYSGLADACRTVRKEKPDTCRQFQCVGCSCLLTAATRATGRGVSVEGVENESDQVVFTLGLKDW